MAVEIIVRGKNEASGALQSAAQDVSAVGEAGTQSESKLKSFFGVMGGAALAGGAAALEIAGTALMDVSSRASDARTALQGLNNVDLQGVLQDASLLEARYGVDLQEVLGSTRTLMSEFGLSSEEAMNLVISGFEKGMNGSGDFLDSIGEYSNLFAENGATADEFFSTLQTGFAGGVLGTDKAADAFKEFGIRVQDGSKATSAALKELGISDVLTKLKNGTIDAADAFTIVQNALRGVEDPLLQAQLGVALFGTQFEDLGASAILGIDMAATSMDDLSATADTGRQTFSSLGEIFPILWGKFTTALLPVNDALLGFINGPGMDFISVLNGNTEAASRLPGPLQEVVSGIQKIGSVASSIQGGLEAFGRSPWGQEIQQGAGVVAAYFSGPFQGDLGRGVEFVQSKFNELAASPWGQDVQRGASVVATYFATDFAADFQRGANLVGGYLNQIGEDASKGAQVVSEALQPVASYMANDFPSDFRQGFDLVSSFFAELPTKVSEGLTAIFDLIDGLGSRAMAAGRGFVENIKEGVLGAIDGLIQAAKDKLAELADLLPGSEPKDPSSPLRGLGERGRAFVGNFGQGAIEAAPQLKATIADVFKQAMMPTIAGFSRVMGDAGVAAVTAAAGAVAGRAMVAATAQVGARPAATGEALRRSGGREGGSGIVINQDLRQAADPVAMRRAALDGTREALRQQGRRADILERNK